MYHLRNPEWGDIWSKLKSLYRRKIVYRVERWLGIKEQFRRVNNDTSDNNKKD